MADTAKMIMDKERAAGNKDMWGFVFQGNAYEGLTCDALEWVKSNGGGQIVEPDGKISINNPKAAEAIDLVKGWVGTISPEGVLAYQEEESRGVWQPGNAVFMRNWPYAYGARQQRRLADQGQVRRDHAAQSVRHGERSAATLGGWKLAVSKYSKHPEAAIDLVKYLGSAEARRRRAIAARQLRPSRPFTRIPTSWRSSRSFRAEEVFLNAVPRPSRPDQQQVQRGLDRVLQRRARDARRQRLGRRQPQEARRQAEAPEGGAW